MAPSLIIAFLVIALMSSVVTQAYYTPPSKVPKEVLKALEAKDVEYDPAKEYVDVSHVHMTIYRFYRIKGLLVYDFKVEMGVKIHAPPDSASIHPDTKMLIEGGRAGYIAVAFAIQVGNKRILLRSPVRIRWYMGVSGLNLYKKIGSSTYVVMESEFEKITAYWKYRKTNVPTLKALEELIKSYRSGNKKAYYDLNGILVIEGRGVIVGNKEASDLIYKLAKSTDKVNCVGYAGIVMKINLYWGTGFYYRVMAWDYGNLDQPVKIEFGKKPPQSWTNTQVTTKASATRTRSRSRTTAVTTAKPKQGGVTTSLDPIVGKEIAIRISAVQSMRFSSRDSGTKKTTLSFIFVLHILPKSIGSRGITAKYWVSDVEVHASDKSREESIKKMLASIGGVRELPFGNVASSVKTLIENIRSSLSSLGISGFDEVVIGHRVYASVPAMYVSLKYGGPIRISGASGKASFVLVGYYDTLLGLPLRVDTSLDMFASDSQGNQVEGHARINALVIKGLQALKEGTKIESVSVKMSSGRVVSVSFTSRNAKVSNVRVTGKTLTFKVSGSGLGTVTIVLPPGTSVRRVVVDGKPVPYSIMASAGGSKILMISMKMSTHTVSIEFSESLSSVKSATPTVTTVVKQGRSVATTLRAATTSEKPRTAASTTKVYTKPKTSAEVTTRVPSETSPKPKVVRTTTTMPNVISELKKHLNMTTLALIGMGIIIVILLVALVAKRA